MFAEQQTMEWKERYKIRAGVEATMSELKRGHGMGKPRVRGLAKSTLAVLCKVTACNIKRWARALSASSWALEGILKRLFPDWRPQGPDLKLQIKIRWVSEYSRLAARVPIAA